MSGSLKSDLFYSDRLKLDEKGKYYPSQIYIQGKIIIDPKTTIN